MLLSRRTLLGRDSVLLDNVDDSYVIIKKDAV